MNKLKDQTDPHMNQKRMLVLKSSALQIYIRTFIKSITEVKAVVVFLSDEEWKIKFSYVQVL